MEPFGLEIPIANRLEHSREANDFRYKIILDQLKWQWLNKEGYFPIDNGKSLSQNDIMDFSNSQTDILDSELYNDPYFNSPIMTFRIENSISTPMFGRTFGHDSIVNTKLSNLLLDFSMYPLNGDIDVMNIEGKSINVIGEDYSTVDQRFKDSAIAQLSMPLITPIELDFASVNLAGLSEVSITLSDLVLEVLLAGRADASPDWSYRCRLVYSKFDGVDWVWKDIDQPISVGHNVQSLRAVWDPGTANLDNPLKYIIDLPPENFIPIGDNNAIMFAPIHLRRDISEFINADKIARLALISYIVPVTDDPDPTAILERYISYEREVPDVPISISSSLASIECQMVLKKDNVGVYEGSVCTGYVPLTNNLAELGSLPDFGDVATVKGIIDRGDFLEEYPIFTYQVSRVAGEDHLILTDPNDLGRYSSLKVEYLPLMPLILKNDASTGFIDHWYLPNIYDTSSSNPVDPYIFEDCIYVSRLRLDSDANIIYTDFVSPSVSPDYMIRSNIGTNPYVVFNFKKYGIVYI